MVKKEAKWSRRDFLRQGAGAMATVAGITLVSPMAVRGTEANSRIKAGMVGVGGRGAWIADLLKEHGGYEITAVADYFARKAQAVGDKLKVPPKRRFSGLDGYKQLVASGVEAVFLETPPYFFPELASAAVDAGCHVYMAKPVAVDVPGSLKIAELGKKATTQKTVFVVDFQTRTDPHHQEAIKRLHEGALGKIATVQSFYNDEGFSDPPLTNTIEPRLEKLIWSNDYELGGSFILNCDIHALDVVCWVTGRLPVRARGAGARNRPDPHGGSLDTYCVTYEYDDGMLLSHFSEHFANRYSGNIGCIAYGQGGYLETNYFKKTWMLGGKQPYRGDVPDNLYVNGARRNIATFHDSIVQGLYDNPTVPSSVESNLTAILGREAARRQTTLTMKQVLDAQETLTLDLSGLQR